MCFLIAKTIRHAIGTAEIDCEWKRTGRMEFEDDDGETVRILSIYDLDEKLQGYRKTVIYLGYGFFQHPRAYYYYEWMTAYGFDVRSAPRKR